MCMSRKKNKSTQIKKILIIASEWGRERNGERLILMSMGFILAVIKQEFVYFQHSTKHSIRCASQ